MRPQRETSAPVDFEQLVDDVGRLLMLPSAFVDALRANGEDSVTLIVPIPRPTPGEAWLTLAQAARLHVVDVGDVTEDAARQRIKRACDAGEIRHRGKGHGRRLDPESLDAWRLRERDKQLDRLDAEGGDA